MNPQLIAMLIQTGASLAELIIRLQAERPRDFDGLEAEMVALRAAADRLRRKPADYLANWTGDGD
jgi:hypothetical protein